MAPCSANLTSFRSRPLSEPGFATLPTGRSCSASVSLSNCSEPPGGGTAPPPPPPMPPTAPIPSIPKVSPFLITASELIADDGADGEATICESTIASPDSLMKAVGGRAVNSMAGNTIPSTSSTAVPASNPTNRRRRNASVSTAITPVTINSTVSRESRLVGERFRIESFRAPSRLIWLRSSLGTKRPSDSTTRVCHGWCSTQCCSSTSIGRGSCDPRPSDTTGASWTSRSDLRTDLTFER
ncbi:MAG: hypothetical protein CM1200mP2_02720 [Planctomycetaceae bacterium]|nr:MAG: hypothetical protein CM1200mP2_02720 [Planctomycetaceae bacterium]